MIKCSWKLKSIFLAGLFTFLPVVASASSNSAVDSEVKNFEVGTIATDAEKAKLRDQYNTAKEKCGLSLQNFGFWAKVQAFQQFDVSWYAATAEFNDSESFKDWRNYLSTIGNVLDATWENGEGRFSGFVNTLQDIERQINYYYEDALKNAKTQEAVDNVKQKYEEIMAKYNELMDVTEEVRSQCEILDTFDSDVIKGINSENLYKYVFCPNGVDYTKEPEKCSESYYIKTTDGTYETVYGNMRGCVPLAVKLNEGRTCIFCPLFYKIFSAANVMASQSYGVLAASLGYVMLIGFAIWIAFSLLGKVSSFTKMDAPKYITELLTQIFKVLVAYLLLKDGTAIYTYALGPLLKGGMEFGMTLLFSNNNYLNACTSLGVENMPTNGLLPSYLYTQLECFIKAVQAELAVPQAIGSSLMCVSMHSAGIDPGALKYVTDYKIPDFSMLFEGLIIWVFAWLLSLAFAFYLVDATVRLGIVGALMPFLIACWPFKITSKYTSQGFTMFMNTFFTYVFMGLVVSINIQLISVSMTGVQGGKDAVIAALNGNKVQVLKDLLDIGFAGFLILIASSIFGFKLCGQAAELAGSMAGGGGGSSIAPEIGGMGYNVAKSAALGTGQKILGGAKFVGEATGVNEKLRKTRDSAVNKLVVSPLAKVFSFGRSGGGASSKTASPSQAPKPQSAPTSSTGSSGSSSVTPDQIRQADNLSNAAPRPTSTAQTTRGASGRAASTQTNNTPNNQASPSDANMDSMTPEQQREQRIDQFNQSHAASLDLERNSELYRQISDQCTQATSNRDAAVQRARSFEAQAKEEMDKATSLREKAQKLADGAEKDALLQQANTSEKNATDFSVQASEERNKEKENDDIVRETLQKMKEMQSDREKTMSKEDVDNVMKQAYGENYRADQTANRNGWNF